MIDALYSGISGISSNQVALNTQSNNISNVNTVAYKSDNISFADLMYQQGIGKGVLVNNINKNFSQGNLKITSNDYDLAIEGPGYFIVKGDSAENLYTRSGNFLMGNDGTLQMQNGYKVQGIATTASVVNTSDTKTTKFNDDFTGFIASTVILSPTNTSTQSINVKTTNYEQSASDDAIANTGQNYKTKKSKINDINAVKLAYTNELNTYASSQITGVVPTKQVTTLQFNIANLVAATSIEVNIDNSQYKVPFQTDKQTTLNNLANKISEGKALSAKVNTSGLFTITSLIPGNNSTISTANISNSGGILNNAIVTTTDAVIGSGKAKLDAIENELKTLITGANAKFLKIENTVDTSDIANKTLANMQLKLDTLNISDNPFGDIEISNGTIFMNQGDSKFVVGKVLTSMFTNVHGLTPKGSNIYSKSKDSGEPIDASSLNKILDKTLELSNTSVAEGLVDLMIYQRAFEANSKSITTSDEFLKTALQLKT
jgi:flagellar hook protein FlgE